MGMKTTKSVGKSKKLPSFVKGLPWVLLIAGIVGLVCSLVLTSDQIKIWQNPGYVPACSLNPVVSCGSVIDSKQGHIFGIPAPFFGLAMFSVIITVGVAILAGARFKRWFWLGLQAAMVGGVAFALWLFWLSMYRIHALCPFCLTTDVAVYATAWYVTLHNIETGIISVPAKLQQAADFIRRHHFDLLIAAYLVIILWILHHFWYYYGQYF